MPLRRAASLRPSFIAPPEIVDRVRTHVDHFGLTTACANLDASRTVLLRVLAGVGVRRGSIALIKLALARLDAAALRRAEAKPSAPAEAKAAAPHDERGAIARTG